MFKVLTYALSRCKRLSSLHLVNKKKSNVYYTLGIMRNRVMSGGAHRGAWQHSSEEILQRW